MHRRTLLVALAAAPLSTIGGLAGCGLVGNGRLEVLTDPDLKARLRAAMAVYAGQRAGLDWSLTAADAVGLYGRAQAPGARVVVTRETRLTDNLRRTRRAPLENRWTVGTKEAPVAIVVTKGAGEPAAKAFAIWLVGPEAPKIV